MKNAVVDGGSSWQIFRKVTLPLLKPTIMLAAVLTTIGAFQVFELFQVMTLGGPANQTRAMSLDIYESAFRFQRMGWSAAVSVVLFLLVFAISIVQSRMLRSNWEYWVARRSSVAARAGATTRRGRLPGERRLSSSRALYTLLSCALGGSRPRHFSG